MPEIITLGEMLIDFVPTINGVTLIDAPAFQKAPGGAPANVAVGLARLGVHSGFMGKVGEDAFGHFLAQTLEQDGVDISALRFSDEARTALAFVTLTADGEREFMFYRNPSADMLYRTDEIDETYVSTARIFHYGSISLIVEPVKSATLYAIQIAKAASALISYDPNLRLNLWPNEREAREGILEAWQLANVIKVAADELLFLSGEKDLSEAACKLWHPELQLLVITMGKQGCMAVTPNETIHVEGFEIRSIDSTGAGDGFVAGLLEGILRSLDDFSSQDSLREICRQANAVGALTTTKRGAIPALPDAARVAEFIQANLSRRDI